MSACQAVLPTAWSVPTLLFIVRDVEQVRQLGLRRLWEPSPPAPALQTSRSPHPSPIAWAPRPLPTNDVCLKLLKIFRASSASRHSSLPRAEVLNHVGSAYALSPSWARLLQATLLSCLSPSQLFGAFCFLKQFPLTDYERVLMLTHLPLSLTRPLLLSQSLRTPSASCLLHGLLHVSSVHGGSL